MNGDEAVRPVEAGGQAAPADRALGYGLWAGLVQWRRLLTQREGRRGNWQAPRTFGEALDEAEGHGQGPGA